MSVLSVRNLLRRRLGAGGGARSSVSNGHQYGEGASGGITLQTASQLTATRAISSKKPLITARLGWLLPLKSAGEVSWKATPARHQ
jgi:hypothetical protein